MAKRVPLRHLLFYASPGIPLALFIPPMPAVLAAFYAQHTAATTAGIGTAMLVARIADALTDPPMGYLSDATKGRWGRRKPWLLAGSFLGMLAMWVFFMPPTGAGNWYFLLGLLLYYVAMTVMNIPLRAWSSELSDDYSERSRLSLYLTTALLVGGLLFFILPPLLAHESVGLLASAEFDRDTMALFGWIGIALIPLLLGAACIGEPVGRSAGQPQTSIIESFKAVRGNGPFWSLMTAESLKYIASGVSYSVLIIALSNYWGFGDRVAIFLLIVIVIQVIAMPPTGWLAIRLGKHRTWGLGVLGQALVFPLIFVMPPGATPFFVIALFGAAISIFQAPHMMMPMAMLTDTADYDLMKSGKQRTGNYFALQHLIYKGMNAVGYSLGYFLLAWVGYDPAIPENTASANLGLQVIVGVVAPVFLLACGVVLFRYPLTAERHAVIQRFIRRREARLSAATQQVPG
ncbi:MAG: hypothetical protein F4080_10435 [Holophagales bacterium]|nr:hypothetical protein [Holophagales bacterium]